MGPNPKEDKLFKIGKRDSTKSANRGIAGMSIAVKKSVNNSSHIVDQPKDISPIDNATLKNNVVSFALEDI